MPRTGWVKNVLAKINVQVLKLITYLKNACDKPLLFVIPQQHDCVFEVKSHTEHLQYKARFQKQRSMIFSVLQPEFMWYVYKQTFCLFNWQEITLRRNWPKVSNVMNIVKGALGLQKKHHLLISTHIPLSSSVFLDVCINTVMSQSSSNYWINLLSKHLLTLIPNMQTRLKAEELCTGDSYRGGEERVTCHNNKKFPARYLFGFYIWGDQKVILQGNENLFLLNSSPVDA